MVLKSMSEFHLAPNYVTALTPLQLIMAMLSQHWGTCWYPLDCCALETPVSVVLTQLGLQVFLPSLRHDIFDFRRAQMLNLASVNPKIILEPTLKTYAQRQDLRYCLLLARKTGLRGPNRVLVGLFQLGNMHTVPTYTLY